VALIAHDEAGMAEAVGSFFEAVAGLEPLTRWSLPEKDALTAAKTAERTSAATVAWEARLPDRVEALVPARGGVTALTHDGTLVTLTAAAGVQTNVKVLSAAEHDRTLKEMLSANASAAVPPTFQRADRLLKLGAAEPNGKRYAVAYWGGTLRVGEADGKAITEQQSPQDVTALAWTGERVIVGLADGRVLSLVVK
jgi:hypothetical protein